MKWNKNPTDAPEPAGRGEFAGTAESTGISSTSLISTDVRKTQEPQVWTASVQQDWGEAGESSPEESTQIFL